jgi:hypothetical protein
MRVIIRPVLGDGPGRGSAWGRNRSDQNMRIHVDGRA